MVESSNLESASQLEGIYSKISKSVKDTQGEFKSLDSLTTSLVGKFGDVLDKVSIFDAKVISTSRSLGQSVSYAQRLESNFANVAERIIKIGGDADDVLEIFKNMSMALERTVYFSEEALFNMAALKKVGVADDTIKSFNKLFDTIGGTFEEASSQQMMLVNQAKSYGLNVTQFMSAVAGQLTKINQYGFPNGVRDLGEMVSRSKMLGMSMETAMSFADKIMSSPETAMDVAAQLQTLGGSFAALGDPMELLYLAQNDLAGLNDKLINATRGLATFNKETGQFEIGVNERLRIKQVATQFGIDANSMIETSLRLAKQEQVLQKLNLQLNFKNIPDADRQLISSYAQITKGGDIKIEGKSSAEFNSGQITDLINRLRGTEKEQLVTDKNAMDENAKRLYDNSSALEKVTIQQNMLSNALSLAAIQSNNFRENLNKVTETFSSIIGFGADLKSKFGQTALNKLNEGSGEFNAVVSSINNVINSQKTTGNISPEQKITLITTDPIKITLENTLNLEKVIKDTVSGVIMNALNSKLSSNTNGEVNSYSR